MRRCLVALSLGGAAAATASAATASAATMVKASVPPAATAATAASAAGISVLVKWVGIAGIGALATWGAVRQIDSAAPIALTTTVAPAPIEVPAATPPEPAEQAPVAEAPPEPEEAPAPVQATPRPTPKPVAAKPQTAPDLAAEVAALDAARKQMEKDPDAALEALSQYGDDFEGGALVQEAEVLRIESLARAGKKKEARAAAASFLARHPGSPAAGRVRALLGSLKAD